mmetsp:Transcript_80296/g.186465  ORF Transcript_80296/g.186465 Transcript_80296/m.186465 type:complete len:133 (+) Transcript_80296:83-481(+)
MQQGSDAFSEEPISWADLLSPSLHEAVDAPGTSISVGPEPAHEVGIQADSHALGLATDALNEQQALKVAGYLRSLRAEGTANIQELLALMRELPAPEGPRVLLNAIRHEQPALFARLHESMLRTKRRVGESE